MSSRAGIIISSASNRSNLLRRADININSKMKKVMKRQKQRSVIRCLFPVSGGRGKSQARSISLSFVLSCLLALTTTTTAVSEEYVDFKNMGTYDHGVQQNVAKMRQYGMIANDIPSSALDRSHPHPRDSSSSCDSSVKDSESCVRSMEYLQRIVKSLLRQMNVHSHVFGPGEAITIDLQAEIKYDDYKVLTKFMNAKQGSDQFLDRVDDIMSNFIHVVEHSASRFEFVDKIINFPAFYSLKCWVIFGTSVVIAALIRMLLVKAFNTPTVHIQLIYSFLVIFIVSCVWSFSSLYEDKKAEMMAHTEQHTKLPKDCDYQNWTTLDSVWYWIRVHVSNYKDGCYEYYTKAMADPFWKVNPMEAVSSSVAFFFFHPLGYIGEKLGAFYLGFVKDAPWVYKPILLSVAILITFLVLYGPFRISSPILTIEPVWRPSNVPALDRSPSHSVRAIGHERVRNEIMERPEGPMVKSVRDASTDMDDFLEYLAGGVDRADELEITGPFARFNLEERNLPSSPRQRPPSPSVAQCQDEGRDATVKCECGKSRDLIVTTIPLTLPKMEKLDCPDPVFEHAPAKEEVTDQVPITEGPLELPL